MAGRPRSRPGRRLGSVALIAIALYSLMVALGDLSPRLGLDLRGGTSVVLTPDKGSHATTGAINQAVDIIRNRVNGLGVSAATVVRQGTNVVISVPGKGRNSVLNLVGQTAALDFRQVFTEAATTAAPSVTHTPTVRTSTGPAASPKPTAAATASTHPAASPSATASSRPDALSQALLATAAAASPTAHATPATSSASPAQTQRTSAATAPSTPGAATPPAYAVRAFTSLHCSPGHVRAPAYVDNPHRWIAACDRTGLVKYLLEPAQLVGTDISSAAATLQNSGPNGVVTGNWIVLLDFKSNVQSRVQRITSALAGTNKQFAIVLDGVVESAPVINSPFSASAQIQGSSTSPFTQTQASSLANVLKYGALPLSFQTSQALSISATLGASSLQAGLLAGAIGLILVILYCFVYYRALGLVTIASLAVSATMVYAVVTLLGQAIGYTLTLAGIAGLIVSVGITADSFVVFYERLKDEVREGRTVRSSVERGWVRARRTILSADTVSFLAAVILYLVSIGDVRGFAFTLGVSTLLDIFTVFLFTKPLVSLLVKRDLFSTSRASGLSPGHAGITSRSAARAAVGPAKEA